MSDPVLSDLSLRPAGQDQIARAREICGSSATLNILVDDFLLGEPNRGEMLDFLEHLKAIHNKEEVEAKILQICSLAGIENPTATDKLLAMQVGLLQDLVASSGRISGHTAHIAREIVKARHQQSMFGPLLAAFLFAKLL
ncbi:hypothetical protein [Burkholderia stabilis]|uniref:hypothetical protein n=1 Tax=Burkholderia stabilis TaxID=95485 RepID=UPI00159166FF|nr:hypothetical protein [Burkholderia stabilis]